MKVIGFTGGIGSGKSTITQYLAELGAVIIDADKVGHEAFEPDTEIWHAVVDAFGREIVAESGEIDRKKLGPIVFGDPDELSRLNGIMHPRMFDMMRVRIDEYREQDVAVVVIEAAILIEADWTPLADEVWVATAPESAILDRLEKQRGMDKEQTLARIRSQLTSEERTKHADVVIHNDGSLDELKATVGQLWERLQA